MIARSNPSRSLVQLLAAIFAATMYPAAVAAATRNVDGGNPLCSDVSGAPYCTVQAAVAASANGDTVVIAAGSYIEQITLDRNVTLRGAGISTVAGACDGQTNILGASPITVMAGARAVVTAVTIKGSFNTLGGGVFNAGTLTLRNSEVCENLTGFRGGGIYTSGRLVMSNVQVYDNSFGFAGTEGGGLYVASGGVALIRKSSFTGNVVSQGGAISVAAGGRLLITNSVIEANRADNTYVSGVAGRGGGIYNAGVAIVDRTQVGSTSFGNVAIDVNPSGGGIYNDGSLLVTRSAIAGNAADSAGPAVGIAFGAGLYNGTSGTASLVSTTVSGNLFNPLLLGYGAGIVNGGSMSLNNVTISNNANGGAALTAAAGVLANAAVTVRNSIIASQQAGLDCDGAITTDGHNLDSDYSCSLVDAASGGTDQPGVVDPGLLPLAHYGGPTTTHDLTEDSPAIDAGDPAGCFANLTGSGAANVALATDQRGSAFVDVPGVGGDPSGCDAGAVEFNLVANGGMEDDADGDHVPDDWTGTGLVGADRLFCLPFLANSGSCAFRLRGSKPATKQLIQEVTRSGGAGDNYQLTIHTAGLSVRGTPVVRLQFDDLQTIGIEEEFVLPLQTGTYAYLEQVLDVTVTSPYAYDVVRVIIEDGTAGGLGIDDVSLVPHP